MFAHPSKASPFGCVVGLLGGFTLVFGGFMWWGLYKALQIEDVEKSAELVRNFGIWGGAATLLGIVIIIVGWRMAWKSDMSSPNDPDKGAVRF